VEKWSIQVQTQTLAYQQLGISIASKNEDLYGDCLVWGLEDEKFFPRMEEEVPRKRYGNVILLPVPQRLRLQKIY
jgi:hypothetical protein